MAGTGEPVVVWGASGHARVVADILRLQGDEVCGFLDDLAPDRRGEKFCGATVLGGADRLAAIRDDGIGHLVVAVGDCAARLRLSEAAKAAGFSLRRAIHPSAVVAGDSEIGAGTVIAAGAVVNPACRIGAAVIVNTGATVDHDCVIADGAHVCPGVTVAGGVRIGHRVFIGAGSSVIDGITIGADAVIGAGAAVTRDVPAEVVAVGVPAKIIRSRTSPGCR